MEFPEPEMIFSLVIFYLTVTHFQISTLPWVPQESLECLPPDPGQATCQAFL